jgi:hypothetical protein
MRSKRRDGFDYAFREENGRGDPHESQRGGVMNSVIRAGLERTLLVAPVHVAIGAVAGRMVHGTHGAVTACSRVGVERASVDHARQVGHRKRKYSQNGNESTQ